jgi:hypothetical protein
MGSCMQQNNNTNHVLSQKDINLKDRKIIVIFS